MKVLLVSTAEQSDSFNHFITAFRNKIGTCEYLCLSEKQANKEDKQLFTQYYKSMAFDRFVASYHSRQSLERLLPLFSGLEQQSLLSLQTEDDAQRTIVAKYARINPWLRWAGSDKKSFEYYKDIGIDAYIMPPLSRGIYAQKKFRSVGRFCCHVLGDKHDLYMASLPETLPYCPYSSADGDVLSYIHNEVKVGDILLITAPQYFERQLVAEAVANGAAVVVPNNQLLLDNTDGFLRRSCITIDHPAELTLLFEQIRDDDNQELVKQISMQAYFCSSEAVASQFARLVGIPGRERSAYMSHWSQWL
ncbi:hypothetical protein KRX19_04740 [Cardiobacteriaceae bacterium TAE3-ERU3]|nr:hypothetical protein [Cardiobacteriaceae bacterium TAE3-ERU3]